jgi:uncharacterized caspase-like protein
MPFWHPVTGLASAGPDAMAQSKSMTTDRSISRRRVLLAGAMAAAAPAATQAAAGRRLALVLGNGAYDGAPLNYPERDALAVAGLLRRCDFRVLAGTNLGVRRMRIAINDLAVALRPGDLAVLYFSGHALQLGGRNYLMPLHTGALSERAIQLECVALGETVQSLVPADRTGVVVILDACRPNAFQRLSGAHGLGLAPVQPAPGTLYAFATQPGQIAFDGDGKHSYYTEALLAALAPPGRTLEQALDHVRTAVETATVEQQTPWYSSALTQPVVLRT